MGIEKLDYFVSAATYLNFTKAARECGVAQSAISQQIASLEADLNCSLFKRNGRSVELTPEGEILFESAKKLQILYQDSVQKSKNIALKKDEYCLTIGISNPESTLELKSKFASWKREIPELELKLERCNPKFIRKELDKHLYDAILCYWISDDENSDYFYEEIQKNPIKVLVSTENPICGKADLTFNEILNQADKLYMSYEIWLHLKHIGLLSPEIEAKTKHFQDSDLLLPMASINQAVVLICDIPKNIPENMTIYPISKENIELKKILLFRKQNNNHLLKKIFESFK